MRAQLPGPPQAQQLNARVAATPDFSAALRERGRQPGFYERLYGRVAGGVQGRAVCPWLQNALFLGHDGVVAACCFIKDSPRFGFGLASEPVAVLLQRRQALADELAAGRIPPACQGCGTAQRVVSA